MMPNIPPEVQNQLVQFQQIQQQLQLVSSQKQHITIQLDELEGTNEAIAELGDADEVFKNVGSILVRVKDLGELKKELKEKKETLEIKMKSLERQETSLKDRYLTLQQEISAKLKELQGGSG